MNLTLRKYALSAVLCSASAMFAAEVESVEMYAIGAGGTTGVWKIDVADLQNSNNISGSSSLQYTGTSNGGGGTFLSSEKVVGVKYSSSPYPFEATAAGNGEGPWTESYFQMSYYITGKVYDMAYDEQADVIYCWYNASSYVKALGIYDPTSHTISRVGSAASNSYLQAIAIDSEGQLWGAGEYGTLFKIDKTTGAVTELTGMMGCGVQFTTSAAMSAAIDPATNLMYVVAKTGTYDTQSSLSSVDLTTLKAQNLGKLPGIFNCLYIAGATVSAEAPNPVEGLTAKYNGSEVEISFIAPSFTVGGSELTGEMKLIPYVDGKQYDTFPVSPGESVHFTLELADGPHEIQIIVSTGYDSKAETVNVYAGYDTPGNINNLNATVDGTNVTLTWDAPEGEHGGLLDTAKISYKVSRNGEVVAEGLTSTAATNAVDTPYAQYTYTVTVMNGDEAGQSQTVNVFVGAPYTAPFTLGLAAVNNLGQAGVEVLDPNLKNTRESETWKLETSGGDTYLTAFKQAYFYMSDFAYLPKMELKAGVDYSVTFGARAITSAYGSYLATLNVVIADAPTTAEGEYKVLDSFEMKPVRESFDWTDFTVNFTLAQDGVYYLGFLAWDQDGMYSNYYVNVKDIAVTAYTAPMYVLNNSQLDALTVRAGSMSGIQFDVELPEGVEFEISEAVLAEMSVDQTVLSGNKKRYVAYTKDGETFMSDFVCTATAKEAQRSTLKITNIIKSVNDEPVREADIEIPVLGYGLDNLTLPSMTAGDSDYLPVPEELNYEDLSISWKPYTGELGELTEDGMFTALGEGTITDLGLTINDPMVSEILEATASMTILGRMGDVNGSGTVDIADVVAVVNYILMRNPEPFNFERADLDGNGSINVADVTRLVKLVLAQSGASRAGTMMRAQVMNGEIKVEGSKSIMSDGKQHIYISLDTDREYTAIQLDVEMTGGVRLGNIAAGDGITAHVIDHASVDNNTTRVVLYSMGLAQLPAGKNLIDLAIDNTDIPEGASMTISSAVSADAEGEAFSHSEVSEPLSNLITGVTSAVVEGVKITTEHRTIEVSAPAEAAVKVIDLQGRTVGEWTGTGSTSVESGLYIVTVTGCAAQKVEVK